MELLPERLWRLNTIDTHHYHIGARALSLPKGAEKSRDDTGVQHHGYDRANGSVRESKHRGYKLAFTPP